MMRASQLWAALAVVLAVAGAACSSGTTSATVPTAGSQPATTAASAGSGSAGQTRLAKAEAYSKCMRSHGVANWPDPVLTPSGGYGFRTAGVDPHSAAFQSATQACNALVPDGWSTGQQLTPSQQQAWLDWAKCIRSHGVPDLPDPTFPGGGAVQISGVAGGSSAALPQSALNACKSRMPTVGGLGG